MDQTKWISLSAEGREFIKKEEGVEKEAYQDQAGVWTIGVGHTRKVYPGQKATDAEIDVWLTEDTQWAMQAVNNYVHVPLNQHMFDALVSLCFNIGETQFRESTLVRKLNEGLYKDAADQFAVWNKVRDPKTKKLEDNKGLTARREREKKLFLKAA